MSVAEQLERSRRDVLDLTLRNPLLNFRRLRAKGLEIIDEIPQEVYRILVRDGRVMYFEASTLSREAESRTETSSPGEDQEIPEQLLSLMEAGDENDPDELAARHVDNKLQTPYESARLGIRLRNTYRHAHSSIEEQGVNILYLALGMLRWYESESSEIERMAPLILVPVELSRSTARARFKVRWTEEEIDANLSLETKLKADFRIGFPELPDAEDLDVDGYFEAVNRAVLSRKRWWVDMSATHLGFFSFSKLLIYKDLDPEAWPDDDHPADHPVIKSLYGGEGFQEDAASIAEDDHLDDRLAVSDTHQVVDSDSSQTLAVIDVKHGRNFVIQGPPGTGKSQTITNLVAEAIADDRKVLFVAEKMAALEVVKRRLDEVHIGAACLELHSHTANKRAVLNELKRTVALGEPKLDDPTEDRLLLEEKRTRLNDYSRAVNSPIGESGYTPHELIGRLGRMERSGSPAEWPVLRIEGSASWSRQEFVRRREVVRELQALIEGIGTPQEHVYWGSGRTHYMPADRWGVRAKLRSALEAFRVCRESVQALAACLGLELAFEKMNFVRVAKLVRTARRIAQAPSLQGVNHRSSKWITRSDRIARLVAEALEFHDLRSAHDSVLTPEAWKCDVLGCRHGISIYGKRWWRFLSGTYRRSRDRLRGLCRGDFPADGDEQLALVDGILRAQRLRKNIEGTRKLLLDIFPGLELDWEPGAYRRLGTTGDWLLSLHEEVESGTLEDGVPDILDRNPSGPELEATANACETHATRLSAALNDVATVLEWRLDRFSNNSALDDRLFAEVESWLASTDGQLDSLHEIVRFNQLEKRLADLGLETLAAIAGSWEEEAKHLVNLFERVCFSAWMEAVFRQRAVLNEFDRDTHQQIIKEFCKLDQDLFRHNRAMVAQLHWERLPRQHGGGQLGILRREFEKKRRHLSLRKLMTEAGNAIQQIKPVFMMSPLSIAKFIPPSSIRFDLVVFDEASQVRPAEAMGAIMRARQAVVVGDSKQLPPTSFFDRMTDDEDEENRSETTDLESILGMFCAQGAPERMLRWHYRSRHESLITVSNNEFYENRLVVFPSPDKGREDLGLDFRHNPEALYKRGRGGRFNAGEARAVAEAVMEHARKSPKLTLGVAAFSLTQARRIEDELEILRRLNPSHEVFFSSHPEEPFFVKNLENVQGDERDIILISIGYGKIEGGKIPMNFGPLNRDGGERRLNVLITRARRRCVVCSNFDDMDMRRTGARGVEVLKIFLKYARTGKLDTPQASGRKADSPFEQAVASELRGRGHSVDHQVGSAGFFIDLAVVDPRRPGRYLLGIECDGASYHSARSARDRDRIRQQVLEGLGWTIHRIWSTDWFRNPQRELAKVEEAIRQAGSDGSNDRNPGPRRRPAPLQRAEGEAGDQAVDATAPYEMSSPEVHLGGRQFHEVANRRMLEWILEVVSVESPIHVNEVALRVANAAGLKRTGRRILGRVGWVVKRGVRQGKLSRKGNFLWRSDHDKVVVRHRYKVPPKLRKPEMIAPEEISAALLHAVRASYGIDANGAVAEASRLFGYRRTGPDIRFNFDKILRWLIKIGVVEERGKHLYPGQVAIPLPRHDPDLETSVRASESQEVSGNFQPTLPANAPQVKLENVQLLNDVEEGWIKFLEQYVALSPAARAETMGALTPSRKAYLNHLLARLHANGYDV